jgi:cellulose synthase/poly-beta-1,6-N-acetylglucosamine synthase-like glycosyltransferase
VYNSIAVAIFFISLGLMVHTYVTYPLSLRLFRRKYANAPVVADSDWPRVALLIPAYNEEKVIGAKLQSVLALDYDPLKLEILVGSDGSTDRTHEIVRSLQVARLRLIELPGRSGKVGVLNRLVTETSAEIVAISDANVLLDRAALKNLVRHFSDPRVGVVNGGKYIRVPAGAENVRGESLYGDYENRLRTLESEVGGMSGALGSLMALRRSLYQPFSKGALNDDTVPAIWAVLAGFRQVHDPDARAFEESGATVREEFRRRIRIGAGNFQTLFRYARVLNPKYGMAAYTYFSHKVIRWIFPLLLLACLISNVALARRAPFDLLLLLQLAGYGAALLGWLCDRAGLRVPVISALYLFVALNIALLLGLFAYLRGIRASTWERTER